MMGARTGCAIVIAGTLASLFVPMFACGQDATSANGNAILARVKAGLRARDRPPYVVYTLVRRDAHNGLPDLQNSYRLRIWCRTIDNAALSRHAAGSRGDGGAQFIMPAFDKPIDPGPPTADLLDVIRQAQSPLSPQPVAPSSAPPVIGSVSVVIETNYHVTYAGVDAGDHHLRLEARRDPDRNRLTDLYVDRATLALHRAVAHDHLYTDGRAVPERFEIVFGTRADVPVITAIHGQTDYSELGAGARGEPLHEVDYRFEDIAFPADLPAWYFEPAQYGAHRSEFPI